jgi:hypothetical protein
VVERYAETWTAATDEFSLEPDHAGLWVRARDYDALAARLAEYEEAHRITVNDCGAPDEQHCSCVPSLRLEAKRLQARLARYEAALRDIAAFGLKNSGCGYSCARKAEAALSTDSADEVQR